MVPLQTHWIRISREGQQICEAEQEYQVILTVRKNSENTAQRHSSAFCVSPLWHSHWLPWTNSLLSGHHPSSEASQTFSGGRELWVDNFKGINSSIVTFHMYTSLKWIWLIKLWVHSRISLFFFCKNYILSLGNSHPPLVLLWITDLGCENLQGTNKGKAHFKLESKKGKHRKFLVFSCFLHI